MTTQHTTRRSRLDRKFGAALLAALALVGVQLASPPTAAADIVYQVHNYDNDGTNGVYLRNSSNINDVVRDAAHYVTYGVNVQLICAEFGSAVGPHSNTAWDYVKVLSGPNMGRYGHLSEHWINTPVSSGQHVSGEPSCSGGGGTPTPPAGGQINNSFLETWFGSPVAGRAPTTYTSRPGIHKRSYGGDWAEDIPAAAGQNAMVYVAPQDGRSSVTTKVESVRPACASHVISSGGYIVQVGVYNGSARIGYIAYAHLKPTVSVGQTVSRWGGVIGTVGTYNRGTCWDGAHVHIEGYNVHHYSCFNGTYSPGQIISRSNFLGFIGGSRGTQINQRCP